MKPTTRWRKNMEIRECIECFRMYDEPDNQDDTCRFCQDGGRQ